MRLVLKTKVSGNYKVIMDRFDLDLFEALKPIGAKMEIVEFTGSQKGDLVHIRFTKPFRTEWISKITDHGSDDKMAFFLDEGDKLPFPLKKWKHKHIVEYETDSQSIIVDDISFSSNNVILDLILYPAMFLGFYPRKKIYKKYFSGLFGQS